jgi:hypothetical protein
MSDAPAVTEPTAAAPARLPPPAGPLVVPGSDTWRVPTWIRGLIFAACIGGVAFAGFWADPGRGEEIDRVMFWTFIIFSVGLAELFLLFMGLAVLGGIDLTTIFQDKVDGIRAARSLSLARLQAFLWTLIVLVTYFHEAVTDGVPGLPTIPAELLLVMGISGATYIASKQISKPGDGE